MTNGAETYPGLRWGGDTFGKDSTFERNSVRSERQRKRLQSHLQTQPRDPGDGEELAFLFLTSRPALADHSRGNLDPPHIREQLTDMKRVKSRIADLTTERQGHVSIACSQALSSFFLPEQIAVYRKEHPGSHI